jgi:hypothetical protein
VHRPGVLVLLTCGLWTDQERPDSRYHGCVV